MEPSPANVVPQGWALVPPPMANGGNIMAEVTSLMKTWEDEQSQSTYDPIPTLTRLAEIIETETENYMKIDPDPFDERHPSRTDPECKLGQILKALFRKDHFMNKLVNDYLRESFYSRSGTNGDINQLNIVACRLMLDVLPGLETSVVFQPEMDSLIFRLIKWATDSADPLQSYATGLVASAMELPDIATRFREPNGLLVPNMLTQLRQLQERSNFIKSEKTNIRPFAHLSTEHETPLKTDEVPKFIKENGERSLTPCKRSATFLSPENQNKVSKDQAPDGTDPAPRKRLKLDSSVNGIQISPARSINETSNSSWAELESFVIGNIQIHPPTLVTKQILTLRYLTPMGEYQEFLSHVFEHNALDLILTYVNVRETKEARLAFEALKYLASLLCHKKFAIEFIQCKGLQVLIDVPRPSIAATGVSICLYYLAYCEESMERVCLLPAHVITSLVNYALWLLECSHDSGRCHATMFFGLTFQFKRILEEFDNQDGLRKLNNVIATLPLLRSEDQEPVNEDAECAARQIVRHVCVAYKRYLEAHLYHKVGIYYRAQIRPMTSTSSTADAANAADQTISIPPIVAQPAYKACKSSPEEVQQQIETLLQIMPFRSHWQPVEQLIKLGAITILLKIISFSYEWNYTGRAETVRSALDALAIACVMPKVQMLLCERLDMPDQTFTAGMNVILSAVEGEIVADPDVQKAALRVLGNCVCAPICRLGGAVARFSGSGIAGTSSSPSKKTKLKSSEELIQKVWDSVRSNSGIMVLLHLMNTKTPITDADCIRTLACKALAGLARSDTVRQIVSELPIITSGQLQSLMRDPILQEKRQEHVSFQKHALELIQRLSGKTKHPGGSVDDSLSNIHRANIVAQTKIQYNDKQLLELIHHHLVTKGLDETASILQKEANLSTLVTNNMAHPSKFRYTSATPLTPTRGRLSVVNTTTPRASSLATSQQQLAVGSSAPSTSINVPSTTSSPAIKLIKRTQPTSSPSQSTVSQISRLQKQTQTLGSEAFMKAATPGVPSLPDAQETTPALEPRITLHSIVSEYLTNQHSTCKNPMSTCPQFNLFVPHKCPDPRPRSASAVNMVMRTARRQMGYFSKQLDRKLVHSRFCPVQTIRVPNDAVGSYSAVKFMPLQNKIITGDNNGEIRLFNIYTGNETEMFPAHDSFISNLEPSYDGQLLLTSSSWGRPQSALWTMSNLDMKYPLEEEEHVEFGKTSLERILGTKTEIATIYDANTGVAITKFHPSISNQYTKNKATFSLLDDMILTDGVLFDVASGTQIHKLDKLNQTQSGVFHPNGLHIVSNTEVWDIRTFHLLKTVPSLNQCTVTFAPASSTLYAIEMEQLTEDEDPTYETSFKILDSTDYTSIATIDVKRSIYDLAINASDTQIALVENQGMYSSVQESVVRIFDVGRRRDDEDDQEEEDDEDEEGDDDDEEDDDDDDDDDGSSDDDDDSELLRNGGGGRNRDRQRDDDDQGANEGGDNGNNGSDDDDPIFEYDDEDDDDWVTQDDSFGDDDSSSMSSVY